MSYWPPGMKTDPIGTWPGEFTRDRRRSSFSSALSNTQHLLNRETDFLDAKDVRLQIAVPAEKFRLDGMPYADAVASHPGVILTMETKWGPMSYPCDTFTTWQDNLRAIALSLESLRRADRYGVVKRGAQYRAFLAIESGYAMPSAPQFTDTAEAISFLAGVAGKGPVGRVPKEELPGLIRLAKFRTHPDTITVDNRPDDYERVVAAEQYLKRTGNIA